MTKHLLIIFRPIDKYTLRASAFSFIKTSLLNYDHVKAFASEIDVMNMIIDKTINFVATIQNNPHAEMTKKNGVQLVNIF
jgi:hypothetical protein